MTGGPDLVESIVPPPAPRTPRSAKRRLTFVSLAGLMAVLGVAARLLAVDAFEEASAMVLGQVRKLLGP